MESQKSVLCIFYLNFCTTIIVILTMCTLNNTRYYIVAVQNSDYKNSNACALELEVMCLQADKSGQYFYQKHLSISAGA